MNVHRLAYFGNLGRHLHLEPRQDLLLLPGLQVHVEDRAQELVESGLQAEEAWDRALRDRGASNDVAERFYEVHSSGTWHHTVLAVMPHVLLALMFAMHLWTRPVWVALMLVVALTISVFGWMQGRPRWTYPWLGYCLVVPIVSWGLAMSAVGYGAWGVVIRGSLPLGIPIYVACLAYIAFSLWIVIRIVSKVARPDWVMASLAVLPIPFLAYWFFYFYNGGGALESSGPPLHEVDSSAAVVFLILAGATAVFFRIGRRLVRVALLVITAPSMVILAWFSYQGGPSYVALFTFSAISLALLLRPALFDLKEDRPPPEPRLLPGPPSKRSV